MLKLKNFRDTAASTADLLNYGSMIADGIVLGKNGSLTTGFFYQAPDAATSTSAELETVSSRLNSAFLRLGSGWMIHTDSVCMSSDLYPMDESRFENDLAREIDEERRQQFMAAGAQYETVNVILITYLPPKTAEAGFYQFLVDDKNQSTGKEAMATKALDFFERSVADLQSYLSSVFKLQRIKDEVIKDSHGKEHRFCRLLQYLQFVVTGENHPIRLPSCPMYIDSILGWADLHGGIHPRIGEKHIRVINIEGLPNRSHPTILAELSTLPLEYRWNTRYIFIDRQEAIKDLKSYRRKWSQKVRGFIDQITKRHDGPIDQDALDMVVDADAALADVSSGKVSFGYYTSVIVLMNEDEQQITEDALACKKVIQDLGFSARIEELNTMEAWLGSMPSHGVQNVRRPPVSTENLADLLPVSSVWAGHVTAPCPLYPKNSPPLMMTFAEGGTAFRANLHCGDVGHTLVLGPTGNGKSLLLSFIAMQFQRYGGRVYCFDKDYSLLPVTLAMGGDHYDLAGSSRELQLCPLSKVQTESDRIWAIEWMEMNLQLQGIQVTPAHRKSLAHALNLVLESQSRSITDYVATLQDRTLREALDHYTVSRALGSLLDARSDNLRTSHFQTFEIGELMQLGSKNSVPVLSYLFRCIEQNADGQTPTLLIIDEAWLALSHDAFKHKIKNWLKTKRKANVAVILATQSIVDIDSSDILSVLLECCPTKILLPNPNAEHPASRPFYEKIGLNSRKIDILTHAIPKRDYLLTNPDGDRLFQLGLGPKAMAFGGATSTRDVAAVKAMHKQYGSEWTTQWLKERNIQ
jgi:type IV secretion system protein VirB4